MRRILVVANLTIGGDHLLAVLRDRLAEGPCRLHVVVPAVPDPTAWSSEEEEEVGAARERLETALKRFAELAPAELTGDVGSDRPLDAIRDLLRTEGDFDEIVLSTLPAGVSRWLKMDLVSRTARMVDVPVTHVEAPPD